MNKNLYIVCKLQNDTNGTDKISPSYFFNSVKKKKYMYI